MKVAVITPYYKESLEMLRRVHDSVIAQSHPDCLHVMVADGHPRDEIDGWNVLHLRLPQSHGDNGNTPRAEGSMAAVGRGYDAVSFLDADNWLEPEHIASLVDLLIKEGTEVAASGRIIRNLAGEILMPEGESRDNLTHFDTSTFLVSGRALDLLPLWREIPRTLSPLCDTIFWYGIIFGGFGFSRSRRHTLNFQSHYFGHYITKWYSGPDSVVSIPCGPTRQAVAASVALENYSMRDLIRLYRAHLPRHAAEESEDASLLRLGTTLAHMGITHHALPLLKAAAPRSKEGKALVRHNIAASLAREYKWVQAIAGEAIVALRATMESDVPGAAAHNLTHLLARMGKLEEVYALMEGGHPPRPVPSDAFDLITAGEGPYMLLVPSQAGWAITECRQ